MQLEERERKRLLALLNGSDKAVRLIESAISRYTLMRPIARDAAQKPTEIKKDADDLHKALQTLVRIIADSGDAWMNFKAGAGAEGLSIPLNMLTDALGPGAGEPGDALVLIAAETAADLKPGIGRPKGADNVSRIGLIFHVANAARDAGVLVSRNSKAFQEISEAVYVAAGIPQSPERDIRDYLEAFTD